MKMRIPYYRVIRGNGFWEPSANMRAASKEGAIDPPLTAIACGPDGPEAWAKARAQNDRWKAYKAGRAEAARKTPSLAVPGSLDEAFRRYRRTGEWEKKAARTREEWDRAWNRIRPVFGDARPSSVTLEQISAFRDLVERRVSTREAHRCVKIWRALWRVCAALGYCARDADPSLGVRNSEAEPRGALWTDAEARALVKCAWRMNYRGLAAAIAVAWDSSLAPVDMRSLTPGQRSPAGDFFDLDRAKTGRAAVATLTRRARRVLDAYLAGLGAALTQSAPIFRNRSGRPYSKDTLGDDFRAVREAVFGPAERRTLADMRRSGAVEALRGGASAEGVGTKLANDFAQSRFLQKTYAPVDLETVRQVDAARKKGRQRKAG